MAVRGRLLGSAASVIILLAFFCHTSHCQTPLIFGIARVIGDSDVHRVNLTSRGDYAEILKVIDRGTAHNTERSDPAVGISTWNPVEKYFYYASAEDGVASAYVTPYDTSLNTSLVQRAMRGTTGTSFTLTSLQFNSRDSLLYGVITYSSGEHFFIRMYVNSTKRDPRVDTQVQFTPLIQLDYTHIVPGLSALRMLTDNEGMVEYLHGVGLRGDRAFLFAVRCRSPPRLEWDQEIDGVLTSIEADLVTGDLFGMLHNASGHYLLRFDMFGNVEPGAARDMSAESTHGAEPEEEGDAEIVLGLSSYAPSTSRGMVPTYHRFRYTSTQNENGSRTDQIEFTTQNVVYTDFDGEVSPYDRKDEHLVSEEGFTLAAIEIGYPRIPELDRAIPSVAHITGGMLVTVRGSPFVDTGPKIICRWTPEDGGEPILSVRTTFIDSSNIICETPAVFTRMRTRLELSLTEGLIWTVNFKEFTFFEILSRLPIEGSSKGDTLIQFSGIYFEDLPARISERGEQLDQASCEFGLPVSEGGIEGTYRVINQLPQAPQLKKSSCREVAIGVGVQLLCSFACVSPVVPHRPCNPNTFDPLQGCLRFSLLCPNDPLEAAYTCQQLVPNYEFFPFRLRFFGQTIVFPEGWQYIGDESPILEFARFAPDFTSLILKFDILSDKARMIGGAAPSSDFIMSADEYLGQDSFATWVLPNRLRLFFGNGVQFQDDTILAVRPYTIASYFNIYRYVSGIFTPEPLDDEDKINPEAQMVVPQDIAQCMEKKVRAGYSKFAGARTLQYKWGLRVGKCIDRYCLNSIHISEKSEPWIAIAQHYLTTQSASATVDAEMTLCGRTETLDMLGANRVLWVLQTRNFLYNERALDLSRDECFAVGEQLADTSCYLCTQDDPDVCPGVSSVMTQHMKIHLSAPPAGSLKAPAYLEVRHGALSLMAAAHAPNGASGPQFTQQCVRGLQFPEIEDLNVIKDQVRMQWTVSELILPDTYALETVQRIALNYELMDSMLASNRIDLAGINVFDATSSVTIPTSVIRPGKFYKVSFEVEASDSSDRRVAKSSMVVFVKRRNITPKVTAIFTKGTGIETYEGTDNVFLTVFLGETMNITAAFTEGLESLGPYTRYQYKWACRMWPGVSNGYAYWDDWIDEDPALGADPCIFNNTDMFPRVHDRDQIARTDMLIDKQTYEFKLEIMVTGLDTTRPDGSEIFRAVQRVSIMRRDSNDFWSTVWMQLKPADGMHPRKARPGEPLILNYKMEQQTFLSAFAHLGGRCRPELPCSYVVEEIGNLVDLTNKDVSNSPTQVIFENPPGELSIIIKPLLVVSGARFVFRATMFNSGRPRGIAELQIDVNSIPRAGRFEVSPPAGDAFADVFTLSALEWEDDEEDLPLRYAFSYELREEDAAYIDDYHPRTAISTRLPMRTTTAESFPCDIFAENPLPLCSMVRIRVYARDIWDAEAVHFVDVPVSLTERSRLWASTHATFLEGMSDGMLGRDFGSMLASFTMTAKALGEDINRQIVNNRAPEDPSLYDAPGYQDAMLNAIINFADFENGNLFEFTPVLSSQLAGAIDAVVEVTGQITDPQRDALFGLIQRSAESLATVRVPLSILSQIILTAANLMRGNLEAAYEKRGRRLLQQEDPVDLVHEVNLVFLENVSLPVCRAALLTAVADADEPTTIDNNPLFYVSFARIGVSDRLRDTTVNLPRTDQCDPIQFTLANWRNDAGRNFCYTVFKYNPVEYTGQTTTDRLSNGQLQQSNNVPWPLHPRSCSLLYRAMDPLTGFTMVRPGEVRIRFQIPPEAARSVFHEFPEYNGLVFRDMMFSASCQEWAEDLSMPPREGTWTVVNSTTSILDSSPDTVCNASHWPELSLLEPPSLASGGVMCVFPSEEAGPGMRRSLFAAVTEKTDCRGTVDTPLTMPTGVEWNDGQFAIVSGVESDREVCDRCKECGGFNECELFCDNKVDSGSTVDVCGVCGGACSLPDCEEPDCMKPYVRYLGNAYPNDWDVGSDGLTDGLFFYDGPCAGPTPDGSPQGICTDVPVGTEMYRTEQYPYNSDWKICWENSPVIPESSPDSKCIFQAGSLRVDDPSLLKPNRTLSMWVLDHDGNMGTEDGIALYPADGKVNGTNPHPDIYEPAEVLESMLDNLQFAPHPHWNSHYPPTRVRSVVFSLGEEGRVDTHVRFTLRPVNDPPKIVAPRDPYVVQEDRPTLLVSPDPIRVEDDGDDVEGTTISLFIRVVREGALIRVGTEPYSSTIHIEDTVARVNAALRALTYLSPENSNDEFEKATLGAGQIVLNVTDNGSGGEYPYNKSFSHILAVNMTTVIANDPPIPIMPRSVSIFQNGSASVLGGHIVDVDMWQHQRRRYESRLTMNQGEISIGMFRSNCSIRFNQPLTFGTPQRLNFVSEQTKLIDGIYGRGQDQRHLFMKLDGRAGSTKVIYLHFRLNNARQNLPLLRNSATSLVVSLFKNDCYDSVVDRGTAANEGTSTEVDCVTEGQVVVNVVACNPLLAAAPFVWDDHLKVNILAERVGVAEFTATRLEWIDAVLDVSQTLPFITSAGDLCLQIHPGSDVQENQRYYGIPAITADAVRRTAREEDLAPRLDVVMGFPGNFTRSNANCTVNVTHGTGNFDKEFRMQASTDASNALLENITYSITSKFSNMLGGTAAKLTLSVVDLAGLLDCLAQPLSFGPQGCSLIQNATTEILIIPYKQERIDVKMQPWYSELWVRAKSIKGELPLVVAFEDCGNRGWFEECPDRMQYLPEFQEGEYQYGVFSVEFSSRLGTFTVPAETRPFLTFEKGTGFRDQVVRFSGFAPDVRRAMMDMIYHTKLDDSLQYKNVYSSEYLEGSIPCSRTCFFSDIGPPTFQQEDEAIGCSSGCSSKIYDRGNNFTVVENGIFLDDIVMTFSDNGVTGIGLTGYTTILMYNVYTVAGNDNPCVIFKGRISEGCRENCAHIGLPFNCFDSGLPFDLDNRFNTTMYEGQEEPILLGGLVAKNVDELESTRLECRTELGQALARRGDGVIDPVWLDECPKLNVIISARVGWTSLNSREFIQIYLGAEQSFWSPIAFLGYTIDVNAAMRMIRYRMSDGNEFFNSNQGTEVVTIQVLDQGFSGADPSGEFDGTNAESLLSFEINIIPVNNIPFITVPRPSDPIFVPENVITQLSKAAEEPGLNITDVDSDECDGILEMTVEVKYGRLFVLAVGQPGFSALASSSQDRMEFFTDPRCQEAECTTFLNQGTCRTRNRCQWLTNENRCRCRRTRAGSQCKALKMRGMQGDVQAAMQAILYVPRPNTNTYSYPEQEAMKILASDKVDPADPTDTRVSCGETLGELLVFAEDEANILVNPVNQPPSTTNSPIIRNFGFETPEVCEGFRDCTDAMMMPDFSVDCIGVASNPSTLGWTMAGRVGVSFTGWVGDVSSTEGRQHLYMAPTADQSASVSQDITGLVVGAYYRLSVMIGARSTATGGAAFALTLGTTLDRLPSISLPVVNYVLGQDALYYESDQFIARKTSYTLSIRSFITADMKPPNGRLNFVDDVKINFINYNMLEGEILRFKSFRVLDADSIPAIEEVLARNGADFDVLITLTCKYGVFSLELDVCSVIPMETGEDRDDKIREWGVRCGIGFYRDVTISEWANSSVAFRTTCPTGWVGAGTPENPCVNLPLTFLNTSWGLYDPELWPDVGMGYPSGQSHIPSRTIQLAGTLGNLQTVIRNKVNYEPDLYFNTMNLGKERVTVLTNDLGNFNGPAIETTQSFPIFVQAVNNHPNITFTKQAEPILEDEPIKVEGVVLNDPDVDEVQCFDEPCPTGKGFLALRVTSSNGSLVHDPSMVYADIDEMVATAYEPYTRDPTIIMCLWKLSCIRQGGYLTLAADDITTFCRAQPERCDEVLTYCTIASMGLADVSIDVCQQTIQSEFVMEIGMPEISLLEQTFQQRLFAHMEVRSMTALIRRRFTLFVGTMAHLRAVFDNSLITYIPDPYYNGIQPLEFFINDIGNEGVGCPPNGNFRGQLEEGLHWDYCANTYPIYPLTQRRNWDIEILSVNNPPVLYMYNDVGTERLDEYVPMDAITNVTKFLNVLEIVDPDILETSGCVMNVEAGTRSGGRMFFNASKAPLLKYLPNIYGTLLAVEGSIQDINIFMRNIEYTSDVQFNGIEAIVFDVSDNGCTGINRDPTGLGLETFILEVNVVRPKTCQFETCEECVSQGVEICGWCPASCEGRGKCRDAVSLGGPPRYGGCDTLCTEEGGCVGWNMCKPGPDRSWIIGAIGSPILLILLVGFYLLFMWARREHGTIPLWFNKAFRHAVRTLNSISFSPKEGAKYGQLAFLAGAYVLSGLLPGVLESLLAPPRQTYSLGEAMTFTLVTDHCSVKFVGDAGLNRSDPALVSLLINQIDDVVVTTDFCEDDQFIRVNNSRQETVRYVGYLCEVEFRIPSDPGHTLPAMTIQNRGSRSTVISSSSPNQFINFGPNAFSFNGTIINIALHNLLCRRIAVPNLFRGFIDIRNSTFTAADISTTHADVFISVSPDVSMLVPYLVEYVQPDNNVCFMSKNDNGVGYEQENRCAEDCVNRSFWEIISEEFDGNLIETNQTGWEIVCEWRCEQLSIARLIPFKRDLQPGLSDVMVELRTETGQLFFSGIPDQRVPPLSGRTLLDNIYVYDGLLDTTPANRLRENLKQRVREYRIDPVAQTLLDEGFHPGGASRPREDWYELQLVGPATPPGQFVWVSNVRYLVLERLLLQVLSLGMLTPTQGLSTLTVASSPCPHSDLGSAVQDFVYAPVSYDPPVEGGRRLLQDDLEVDSVGNTQYLKQYYRLLYDAVNGLEIPRTSMIVYKPLGNAPFISFGRDSDTGEVTVTQVAISDYPLIQLLLVLGILIPALISLIITFLIIVKGRVRIKTFRTRKFDKEHTARLLLDLRHNSQLTEAQKNAKEKSLDELKEELYSKTNFFYFLDYQIGDPDKAQSIQTQIKYSFVHLCVVVIAVLPLLIFAVNWETGRKAFSCPTAPDVKACEAAWSTPAILIYGLVVIHGIISFVELYCFYALLPWARWRKILRLTWYGSQALMMFLSVMYLLVVITWIFIGLIVTPSQYLPYCIGFTLSLGVLARFVTKTLAHQKRLRNAISERVKAYTARDFGRIQNVVVENIVDRQIHRLLKKRHLSGTAVTRGTFVLFMVLFIVQCFLFIGFHALTDVTSIGLGAFKSVVTAVAILAVDAVVNRKRDYIIRKQDMALIVYEILTEAKKGVAYIKHQVDMGEMLVERMRKQLKDIEEAELANKFKDEKEVGGKGFNPEDWYRMPTAAAKTMIHDDHWRPGDTKRIAIDVPEVEPHVDYSAMPAAYEPDTHAYHPDYYKDSGRPEAEEPEGGMLGGPTVVMTLEGEDEGMADPQELAMRLADLLGVSPERFSIQVAEF